MNLCILCKREEDFINLFIRVSRFYELCCRLCRFNKREEDFSSLKEYNNYLEEVEDMSKLMAASKTQPMQGENGASASNNSQAGTSAIAPLQFLAVPNRPLGMAQQPAPVGYGSGHESEDAENMKERFEKAARARGWSMEFSKKRALEEAFGHGGKPVTCNVKLR
ncbi:hypothetical protein LIER_23587 [Lithospermum erythrorhizon]|uniref:MAT1 centre domain-containing protein n=1 Tax=Lithospermum erythrorhizon TaxID=34254 RepID=A0AAV3R0E4_LITER